MSGSARACGGVALAALFVAGLGSMSGGRADDAVPAEVARHPLHLERPADAPALPGPRRTAPPMPAAKLRRGGNQSVQVNVDANGDNILGDAANEPSIAVDPRNPARMVIAWRQFDSVASNFRQAGWGYSQDGGRSWTFPGVLDPGLFRSDPVLAADAEGRFYFMSLGETYAEDLFRSVDHGQTWSRRTPAYGGDKEWFTIDRTGGIGHGNIYASWQRYYNCCGDSTFTRSTDGGLTFSYPVTIPGYPSFGTQAVDPDGTVYVAGLKYTLPGTYDWFTVGRSTNAKDPASTPSFTSYDVDLGGALALEYLPNPDGLMGQVWIAVDHSTGPTRGYVYVLCSVDPPGADSMDVHLVRSVDGGQTWSAPIRINDDAPESRAWQWFGTLSVAPNGRIDAIWNDSRNSASPYGAEVFYSYSTDGGLTWATNVPVSPMFDSSVGWPQQNKIGDYYHMVSDNAGADLAYAATFNGEEDVYYLRIGPRDCNANGVDDDADIAGGTSQDCNSNHVPDECEPGGLTDCNTNGVPDVCDIYAGTSQDCNGNDVPDECEIAVGTSEDCNHNQVPDECEVGGTTDCNHNGIPDLCDIYNGTSVDCPGFGNGVPDECEPDCNGNGVVDTCDIAHGTLADCNSNGVPDTCELNPTTVQFTLNTSPGWSVAGEWAFGHPAGLGGGTYGYPDPSNGATGSNVYGVNLNGNYATTVGGPWYVTAGPIVVNPSPQVTLRYQRWLNSDRTPRVTCTVQASRDGQNWTTVWTNSSTAIAENAWSLREHDLSAVVGGSSQVWVRWGYQVGSSARRYSGWNIDDIQIVSAPSSPDCNSNQIPDACDIASGFSQDCNHNGVPDNCDIAGGAVDCNQNSVPDSCDIASGTSQDCNQNAVPDECDIAAGTSPDVNSNGVPDECEPDCNSNGLPDSWEISTGQVPDCNGNGVPDSCDMAGGLSPDCNTNGVPDECDLAVGTSPDCNQNGYPDECDLWPQPFEVSSPMLTPLGGSPQVYPLTVPRAAGDVTLSFDAFGDLNYSTENVAVQLDGAPLGTVYAGDYRDCTPNQLDGLIAPLATFNAALDDGEASLTMIPSTDVNPYECGSMGSYIRVRLSYIAVPRSVDVNGNGVPDECEAPPICRGDCNCDHTVGFNDIDLFVAAIPNNLANWTAKYQAYYGSPPPAGCWANCDVNGNGNVGFDDIDVFVSKIPSACP